MIHLRDLKEGDKERLLRWRNLPEVADYMYTDHAITEDEHERWWAALARDTSRRYWIINLDEEDVGLANVYAIDRHNQRCYWAFYLASANVRGRGVGGFVEYFILSYVFDELGLNKLCCEVLATNEAVVGMHKGFGFSQEGLFRQHVIKGGQPLDIVCLAMLQAEWKGRKQQIEEKLRRKGVLGGGHDVKRG